MQVTPISPHCISGFTTADGSFFISVEKSLCSAFGWRFKPIFAISQHNNSKNVLHEIRDYFQIGGVFLQNQGCSLYRVSSRKALRERIAPHFVKYPPGGEKKDQFLRWFTLCKALDAGTHKTRIGFAAIATALLCCDPCLRRQQKIQGLLTRLCEESSALKCDRLQFSGLVAKAVTVLQSETPGVWKNKGKDVERVENCASTQGLTAFSSPLFEVSETLAVLHPAFVVGLIDGDGCFSIAFRQNGRICPRFSIVQCAANGPLLSDLQNFFEFEGAGKIYTIKKKIGPLACLESMQPPQSLPFAPASTLSQPFPTIYRRYDIWSESVLRSAFKGLFGNTPLRTAKQKHWRVFDEVCTRLCAAKAANREARLKEIVKIAYKQNFNGKRRRQNMALVLENLTGKDS